MMYIDNIYSMIRRYRNSRGYGVHSPTDYYFIKNVIRQSLPYYIYENISLETKKASEKKLLKLLFRLSNYLQPETILTFDDERKLKEKYIKAGCKKAKTNARYYKTKCLIYAKINDNIIDIIDCIADESIIVIDKINKSKQAKTLWNNIKTHTNISTTFDIKQAAIAIVGCKKHQKHYKLYI